MDYVCTFVDRDGYCMSILARGHGQEEKAWEAARDKASEISKTDDWARFKIESGEMTSEGWIPMHNSQEKRMEG